MIVNTKSKVFETVGSCHWTSTGFTPFELLYGRSLRTPMTILKELWTGEVEDQENVSTYQYVIDLRERIEETCALAKEQLAERTVDWDPEEESEILQSPSQKQRITARRPSTTVVVTTVVLVWTAAPYSHSQNEISLCYLGEVHLLQNLVGIDANI